VGGFQASSHRLPWVVFQASSHRLRGWFFKHRAIVYVGGFSSIEPSSTVGGFSSIEPSSTWVVFKHRIIVHSVGSFLKLSGALDGDAEFFEFAVEGGAGEAKDLCTAPNVT